MTSESMDTVGLVAAVLQVADIGVRLSHKLAAFKSDAINGEASIDFVYKDISYTSSILSELGQNLKRDYVARTCSETIHSTTCAVISDCRAIFDEMDNILADKLSKLERARKAESLTRLSVERATWSFLQPKIEMLWGKLKKLKTTLLLMLNVIIYAKLVDERCVI